ncbi:MAG: glycosyltransferase [Candidatus Dormibacteraeota bacterium]|nr:glycosyltransferase [Candidatus Dormibacteraeota bacterium]
MLPFAAAARADGHQLLLVTPKSGGPRAEAAGIPVALGDDPPEEDVSWIWAEFAAATPRRRARLVDGLLFPGPRAVALLPTMERATRSWRPDLILREPCEYSSAVVALNLEVPQATVAISQGRVEAGALRLAGRTLDQRRAGTAAALRGTPYLSRFPSSLDPDRFPDTRRYRALEEAGCPWRGRWGDDPRPLVYLTLGTVAPTVASQAGATFQAMAEAVSQLPVRGLLTVAEGPHRLPGGPPANLQVEPFVPQATVMGEAAVVVCHGGSGTVLGALGAGVPLVILPMLADQLANGTMVVRAGAGLVLEPPLGAAAVPGGAASIRSAVLRVLGEPAFRVAAQGIAAEMRRALPPDIQLRALWEPRAN